MIFFCICKHVSDKVQKCTLFHSLDFWWMQHTYIVVKCPQCYRLLTVYSDTFKKSLIMITNAVRTEIRNIFEKLYTLPEHQSSPRLYCEVCVAPSLFVCVVYFRSLFVLLFFVLFGIVLFVLRFTSPDYPIGFFKPFLSPWQPSNIHCACQTPTRGQYFKTLSGIRFILQWWKI